MLPLHVTLLLPPRTTQNTNPRNIRLKQALAPLNRRFSNYIDIFFISIYPKIYVRYIRVFPLLEETLIKPRAKTIVDAFDPYAIDPNATGAR